MKNYIIAYGIYYTDGTYTPHKTKVKNCMGELHAKVKLEGYLRTKHQLFRELVVYSCKEEFVSPFKGYDVPDFFNKFYWNK